MALTVLSRCGLRVAAASHTMLPLGSSSPPVRAVVSSSIWRSYAGGSIPSQSQLPLQCSFGMRKLRTHAAAKFVAPTALIKTRVIHSHPHSDPHSHQRLGIRMFHGSSNRHVFSSSTIPRRNTFRGRGKSGSGIPTPPAVWLPFTSISGRRTTVPATKSPQLSSRTRGQANCAIAAENGHLGGESNLSKHIAPTDDADMGDRNVLPDDFKPGHYDLVLTDLDFKNWAYNGSVTYAFSPYCLPPLLTHTMKVCSTHHHR